MRLQWLRDRLHNERGSVLLFTFTLLVFLLVMGGFAIDFAFQAASRTELQRSIDAAALAGAGKLGLRRDGLRYRALERPGLRDPEPHANRSGDPRPQ